MLHEIRKNIKILGMNFKYNIAKEMENRCSFILRIAFMLLNNILFIVQLIVFFSFKNTIGGCDFKDVLMLWAVLSASYGISHLFFENVYFIPNLIVTGKLDAYITQPLNILWNISISRTNPSTFGDLIYGTVLAFISSGVDFYKILLFIICSFLGAIIMTAFSVIASSLTFWLKRGEQIAYSLDFTVLTLGTYPEGIFKGFIKILLYTVIPVGFMFYTPLRVILNYDLFSLFIVILVALFSTLLAFYIFNKGLKRYSSSNLMNARV
jgi:ABC-2 type transport system permease protein